jgi:hypothetical protein
MRDMTDDPIEQRFREIERTLAMLAARQLLLAAEVDQLRQTIAAGGRTLAAASWNS